MNFTKHRYAGYVATNKWTTVADGSGTVLTTDSQIIDFFGEEDKILATIAKDPIKTADDALIEIYKKLRPGELPTADAARNLFSGLLFDPRRYDLARVGRYKFNQKLSLATRITNQVAFADIVNPETGEFFVEKDFQDNYLCDIFNCNDDLFVCVSADCSV